LLGKVRIIGGRWRGRQIIVPTIAAVRPTPNRVRETLFNWLHNYLPGANCLDAFAGSGALGFEALSRGAATVVMLDKLESVTKVLTATSKILAAEQTNIYCANFPYDSSWLLRSPIKSFDIVFLDPPYNAQLLAPSLRFLQTQQLLAAAAHVYVESNQALLDLPPSWFSAKAKVAGQVHYYLLQWNK
jgi:16S rRNA (guanine966-N2)-methyltransferase